jgi:hypothetical protein
MKCVVKSLVLLCSGAVDVKAMYRCCQIIGILSALVLGLNADAQDRLPDTQYAFPDDCFHHAGKGGRILDVTKPPFGADPRPSTAEHPHDDTAAIVKAFEFSAALQRQWPIRTRELNSGKRESPTRDGHSYRLEDSYIIYLPDGVYDVSDTLACVEEPEFFHRLGMVFLRVWGQSREGTVIRLKGNQPKFAQGAARPVISYNKGNGSPAETVNSLANLTIDTGRGNPGAIGVVYVAANRGDVRNLLIRSSDGQGTAGIYLPYGAVIGCFHDITIDGFDRGVHAVSASGVNPVFEHLTLRNQNIAGIEVERSYCFVRRLQSINRVAAVSLTGDGSVQIIDSRLVAPGGQKTAPAATNVGPQGFLFARNVQTEGYGIALARNGKPAVTDARISEWTSHSPSTLFDGSPKTSMNLQVRDAPMVPRFDPRSEWTCPESHRLAGDDTDDDTRAIQAAFDSGEPCVYFPRAVYRITSPIRVPAHVRRVDFLFAVPRGVGVFEVAEKSAHPLLIENVGIKGTVRVELRQPRQLVLRCGELDFSSHLADGEQAHVYLESMRGGGDRFCPAGQSIWARGLNGENANKCNWRGNGGLLWSAGHKSEKRNAAYWVENGGVVESLGGYAVVYAGSEQPRFVNDNSQVAIIGAVSFGQQPWPLQVQETRAGAERTLKQSALRQRTAGGGLVLPFYAGYDPRKLPPHDQTAPAPIKNLRAAKTSGGAMLSWDECLEPDFGAYHVYRQDAPGGEFTLLATTGEPRLMNRRPVDGAVYRVTAADTAGNEAETIISKGPY